ncbi:MAG: hypothetical protein ACRD2L_20955 [Terriglobia bacterium]
MEYIEGKTLDGLISESTKKPVSVTLDLVKQVAEATCPPTPASLSLDSSGRSHQGIATSKRLRGLRAMMSGLGCWNTTAET